MPTDVANSGNHEKEAGGAEEGGSLRRLEIREAARKAAPRS